MHPALAAFPSRRFYAARLASAVAAAQRAPPAGVRWPNASCALAFVEVLREERLGLANPTPNPAPTLPLTRWRARSASSYPPPPGPGSLHTGSLHAGSLHSSTRKPTPPLG
jgi:hypothetical protein